MGVLIKKLFFVFMFSILLVISVYAVSRGRGGDIEDVDADDNDTDSEDSLNEARGDMMEERGEIREERRQIKSQMMRDGLRTPRAMEIRRKLNDIKLERAETSGLRCFEEDDRFSSGR